MFPLTVWLHPISQLEKQRQRGQCGPEAVNQGSGLPPHTQTHRYNYAQLEQRSWKRKRKTETNPLRNCHHFKALIAWQRRQRAWQRGIQSRQCRMCVCVFVFLPRGLPVSSDLYRKKGDANIQLHLGPFQTYTRCLPEVEELCWE